jgi:D-alanyl-D-alanine carboxypeptidase
VIAGFQFGSGVTSLPTIQQPQSRTIPPDSGKDILPPDSGKNILPPDAGKDDEDAAESRPDPLLDSTILESPSAVPPPQPRTALPAASQLKKPQAKDTKAPTVLASLPLATVAPHDAVAASPPSAPSLPTISAGSIPLPTPKPHLSVADYQPEAIAVVAKTSAPKPAQDAEPAENYWTVQIGAFSNAALARSKLATYAERSGDILGQASRIVAPVQSADGHTLYRARFGPFAERDARQVCEALTTRGENCFAAVAAR